MINRLKVCEKFLDGEGQCFLTGKFCDYPYSSDYCESQYACENEYNDKVKTKDEIFRIAGINKGDIIADYFVPDYIIKEVMDFMIFVKYGINKVVKEIKIAGYFVRCNDLHIYRNVELTKGVIGTYILAKGSYSTHGDYKGSFMI